ncbi:MAG: Lrp/AsnC family transcriptional regulator [Candidatus Bathyarchaeota archaeon]|nr:Lrp/AsnC family transcriptional regulator [Candidatus Bathyarchaeota archaeon]
MQTNSIESMHSIDFQIISLLQEDCRLSFNKIARNLGISVGTAFNHVKDLEKKGIVKSYTAVVDAAKLGYTLTALILVQTEGSQLSQIEQEIANTAAATAVYDITSDYDIAVIAKFKDRASLNTYLKNLLASPHIKRTVTNIALNVIKEDMRIKL